MKTTTTMSVFGYPVDAARKFVVRASSRKRAKVLGEFTSYADACACLSANYGAVLSYFVKK